MPKQVVSTVQYMKELFQDSLITGIPQIVLTHSISRKIIKSIVLSCCFIGFIYQTTEFMKIFWSYPTVLDIDVEYPEVIQSPAITYCNLNGIKRTHFCDSYPEKCSLPQNLTQFCDSFPDICNRHESADSGMNLRFPTGDALRFEETVTIDQLKQLGHSSRDILTHCQQMNIDGHSFAECSWNDMISMAMPDGNTGYRNCYTLFSVMRSTTLKQHILPVPKKKDALFHIAFEMEPQEYFRPDRQVGVIVAIHSPNSIVNPFYDGFVIKPGNLYSVHLKVVEEKLLPFPYETQCKDYESMWKMRGGRGPLSQEMCLAECVYNASLEQCNCVMPDILYYHDKRICKDSEMDCFNFSVTECYSVCKQPCYFTDFEYDVQERKLENNMAETIEDFYKTESITQHRAAVLIFLKRPEIIIYSHRPQYEDIEVFSFMGGYVGMWLGISLVGVFDFMESIVLLTYFWLKKQF